jgi:hypothetical protein
MKKKYFIYSILVCFLLVIILFYSIDFTTSIIPGWHITIYPRWILALISIAFIGFLGLLIFIVIKIINLIFKLNNK